MYKYTMTLDSILYTALFVDHFEAGDFLDENAREGTKVVLLGYEEVSAEDILADEDFEWSYRVEMASELLLPNAHDFHKWSEQESELKRLGYIA